MPAAQLVTAALETFINSVLQLDEQSQQRLLPLAEKQLCVELQEFPWPITFVFSDRIDLLVNSDAQADCLMRLSVQTLPQLQDNSQLTQLIQDRKLELIGDIHVAQSFSLLLKELDIDWEEQLARYTGDVVAHQSMQLFKSAQQQFSTRMQSFGSMLSEGALQEKRIAVAALEVKAFNQQVNDLRADTARLEAHLNQLFIHKK
ncbi:SCP2 sterol-binding domain-containing protein [Alteromonadaceae bacterium BrNp21-10]|nr:SCP2 sterol-binding domain-containing protein [Alteromonadaceae bacterium BrNp21-10]